ncbi:MAG: thioesterase family protein [Flavihumibacter sp.]
MARVKIDLPEHFSFTTVVPVRITDLNYGGHLGNDSILTLAHEARMQYLQSFGYSETDLGGVGMIMADAAIEFKQEVFYGDRVEISVAAANFSAVSFDLYYKLEKPRDGNKVLVAAIKTGMVCFDYSKKKVARLPDTVREKIAAAG